MQRSPQSTDDRPAAERTRRRTVNVHDAERAVSVIGGVWLLARSLQPPSLRHAPGALAGAALLLRGLTGHCHTYAALGLSTASNGAATDHEPASDRLDLRQSITIGKSADELYRLWQEPRTLPRLFGHFAEVEVTDSEQIRWRVHGPLKQTLEFSTRVVEQRQAELLRWESEPQSSQLAGSVTFKRAPRELGTEVTLQLTLQPPAGRVGAMLVKLLGPVPKLLLQKALRRFKSLAETGEIPTLMQNPAARDSGQDEASDGRRA